MSGHTHSSLYAKALQICVTTQMRRYSPNIVNLYSQLLRDGKQHFSPCKTYIHTLPKEVVSHFKIPNEVDAPRSSTWPRDDGSCLK